MLKTVTLTPKTLSSYSQIAPNEQLEEVRRIAREFKDQKVLHISATANGGGVAAILSSFIPLLKDVGIHAEWQVLEADNAFFEITKKIHNGLQGGIQPISHNEWQKYWAYNEKLSKAINAEEWDYIVVHDPQPLGAILNNQDNTNWIWRYHGDGSHANSAVYKELMPVVSMYKGAIYTLEGYKLPANTRSTAIPVAIDPLARPVSIGKAGAKKAIAEFGVSPEKPLAVQVSRFDPWKDPLGVIAAWEKAKKSVPALQLALVGNTADDDPESQRVLKSVLGKAKGRKDLFIVADQASGEDVGHFQEAAEVVLQKSLREGFALTVAEALWVKTPVVGSRVGGIPLQVIDGQTGLLVDGIEDAASSIVKLIKNPELAEKLGKAGHKLVSEKFLMPKMLSAHLSFLNSLR